MLRRPRAVVFDLDDTLYSYRRFVLSGFVAVAAHVEETYGIDRRRTFALLSHAYRGPSRGRELQACLEALGLPAALTTPLLDVIRSHRPNLRLPASSVDVLDALRRSGWRIGILTNGSYAIQARKIAALDLVRRVDRIVYATLHGTGAGKPDPEAFLEAARRLGVRPERVVFVGNDETCDVGGAIAAGMWAIRVVSRSHVLSSPTAAAAVTDTLSAIPRVVHALLGEAPESHAA